MLQFHVTAQFYSERKGKYFLKVWGWVNPKDWREEKPLAQFWLLFLCFFLLPLSLPYVNWAVCFTWGPQTFLCSIFMGFFLLCLLATTILDSFFLFQLLNIPPSRDGGPNYLQVRGVVTFLATSCWTGMARGFGPPPLDSLKPQSPYSSVHLKLSDIFHGHL